MRFSAIDFVRKSSPRLITGAMLYVAPVQILYRYLVQTLPGYFILAVFVYGYAVFFSESKPYSCEQLFLWVDGLSEDIKASIVTTLVTIFGFLVAFHTGKENWLFQARTQLKLEVAKQIQLFYREALAEISDLQHFSESILGTLNRYENEGVSPRVQSDVSWSLRKVAEYEKARDALSSMTVRAPDLVGSNFLLLSTIPGAIDALKDCQRSLNEIAENMWVLTPVVDPRDPDPVTTFVSQIDRARYQLLYDLCDTNSNYITGTHATVVGSLIQVVTGFNLHSILTVTKDRKEFTAAFESLRPKP